MMELVKVVSEHLPAVERDLIVSGFHLYDVGTPKMEWAEFQAFVMSAPPNTAIHTSRTDAWNLEAQKIALMSKPPVGGVGADGRPLRQASMSAPTPGPNGQPIDRRQRGRNLRNERAAQQQAAAALGGQTKQLMANATPLPLDEWKERYQKLHPKEEKSEVDGTQG